MYAHSQTGMPTKYYHRYMQKYACEPVSLRAGCRSVKLCQPHSVLDFHIKRECWRSCETFNLWICSISPGGGRTLSIDLHQGWMYGTGSKCLAAKLDRHDLKQPQFVVPMGHELPAICIQHKFSLQIGVLPHIEALHDRNNLQETPL